MVVVIRNIVMVVVLHCKINGSTKSLDFLLALLSRIFLSRSLISICFASKVGYAKQEQWDKFKMSDIGENHVESIVDQSKVDLVALQGQELR